MRIFATIVASFSCFCRCQGTENTYKHYFQYLLHLWGQAVLSVQLLQQLQIGLQLAVMDRHDAAIIAIHSAVEMCIRDREWDFMVGALKAHQRDALPVVALHFAGFIVLPCDDIGARVGKAVQMCIRDRVWALWPITGLPRR